MTAPEISDPLGDDRSSPLNPDRRWPRRHRKKSVYFRPHAEHGTWKIDVKVAILSWARRVDYLCDEPSMTLDDSAERPRGH